MPQLTLRIPDELSLRLKRVAGRRGDSVNRYATAVLDAATNPDLAGDEAARVRERLDRAGLLERLPSVDGPHPSARRLAAARRRAGKGQPLSDVVSEGRR